MFDPNKRCIVVEGLVSDGEEILSDKCTALYTETIVNALRLLMRGKLNGWVFITEISELGNDSVSISIAEKMTNGSAVGTLSFQGTKEDMQALLVFVYFYLKMHVVMVSDVTRAIDRLVPPSVKEAAASWIDGQGSMKFALLYACNIGDEVRDAEPGELPLDEYLFDDILAAIGLWYEMGKETRFIPFFHMLNA